MGGSPPRSFWIALAGVAGALVALSGLDLSLSTIPFVLDPSFVEQDVQTLAIYFFVVLVFPLSIAVFVAALRKDAKLAVYGSVAILISTVSWRLVSGWFFGFDTWMLPFVGLFSEYAFLDFATSVFSTYVALDSVLALLLVVLTILQQYSLRLTESAVPSATGSAGRASQPVFCSSCGTPGVANQFCQGCGTKLMAPVTTI